MTEKKTVEEFLKLPENVGKLKYCPAHFFPMFVHLIEAYAAQQSKMPTEEEIQEAAYSYACYAPIVDQSRMGFKAGVQWLRNQIG